MPFRRPAPLLLPLLASLALAGCAAVGPDYRAPDPGAPDVWQAAADGIDAARRDALAHWWIRFDDPLLHALIERALTANPGLASTEAALRQTRAKARAADAERAPSLDAAADARRSNSAGASANNRFSVGFDASWEIDVFGGTRRAIEATQADLGAAGADLDAARVSLAAEVARQYVALRSAQQRLAIAQANLASQTETLQFTDWRVQAGLASAVDLEQARGNRAQTAAQIPALEAGRREAGNALAVLLGAAPGTLPDDLRDGLDAPGALPDMPARIAIGIPADTLRQRPDVRAAERRLAAETARIGVAEADRYPSLSLSGSIGLEAATLGALDGPGTVARSLLASLGGPLFDAGRRAAQVAAQEAVRDARFADYRETVLTALQDVENALNTLDAAQRREISLNEAVAAARAAAELARQRYQGGLIDFQTVLDTDRTRLSVEDSLASVRAERVTALIQLYKALGGGWDASAEAARATAPQTPAPPAPEVPR